MFHVHVNVLERFNNCTAVITHWLHEVTAGYLISMPWHLGAVYAP